MDIKIYALISCIPLLYVFHKFIHKKDINSFDILLSFHTLYFAIIPLIFNTKDIEYSIVRNNEQIRFETFIYYTLFIYTLLFIDIYYSSKKRKDSIINFTYSIRQWIIICNLKNSIIYKILIIEILLIIIQYITYKIAAAVGVGTMETFRENSKALQTPFSMFLLNSAGLLRLYILFIIINLWIKNKFKIKKERWLFYIENIILILLFLQISRTYIFEAFIIILLIVYSTYKKHIKLKHYIKASIGILLIVGLIFPFVTAFRKAKKNAIINQQESIVKIINETFEIISNGNMEEKGIDNKGTRSWGAYQNLVLSSFYPYEGNGKLTLEAISFGIPKIIYPQKSQFGSQGIIEKELKIYTDLTDSILLFSQMENRTIGFLYANFIFICLLLFWEKLKKIFFKVLKCNIITPLFFIEAIFLTSRIETSPDQFISTFIQFMIWPFLIFLLLHKSTKKTCIHEKYSSNSTQQSTLWKRTFQHRSIQSNER